jgi:hypothetical protein
VHCPLRGPRSLRPSSIAVHLSVSVICQPVISSNGATPHSLLYTAIRDSRIVAVGRSATRICFVFLTFFRRNEWRAPADLIVDDATWRLFPNIIQVQGPRMLAGRNHR